MTVPARPLLFGVIALTLGAACIHIAVAPMHFLEWAPFGVSFLAAAAVQVALAGALILTPTRRFLALSVAANMALVVVWAISRSVGLPVGPAPWHPEAIGLTDLLCVLVETLASVFAILCLLSPARPRLPVALTSAPVVILAAVLSATGVAAASNGMVYAFNVAPLVPGAAQVSMSRLTAAPGNEPVRSFSLVAAPTPTGYAYNSTVPGPELRVRQGERVRVTLVNRLPVPTTVHWHGVVLPNAMDGVAGVTQDAVPPGASFVYEFVARDAGTYWYHSHQKTLTQLAAGLYGSLIVEPAAGVAENRDYTLLVHILADGSPAVNGVRGGLALLARPGETVRLRVINATLPGMDGSPMDPALVGAPVRIAAHDGRDIPAGSLLDATRVPLGMGERVDLVFTMPTSGAVRLAPGAFQGQQTVKVTIGSGPAPKASVASWPLADLARYAGTEATPAPDLTVPLLLDEHPGIRNGVPQLIHTINGAASPDSPVIHVKEGQRVRLHIVNRTAEYHPIHLHGHVLAVAGSSLRGDTILVAPDATMDVAFTADNPGVWMLHCHVLLHADAGMVTTVVYDGYGTPFEMGTRSGNMPE